EHAEKAGDVETVTTSVDTKGRRQPTSKPRKSDKLAKAGRKRKSDPPPTQLTVAEQSIDKHLADRARADIGPDSAAEADRLRARNEELARENHRLARENLALRSEVDELKAELAKRAPIDGLDIPACLRRGAPRASHRAKAPNHPLEARGQHEEDHANDHTNFAPHAGPSRCARAPNPNNASGAGPFRQHGTVWRDLRQMRVSRLPPANSQQERRHRQDGPSRRLREVLPPPPQSPAGRACTCGSVPVLRVQRRTAMTEDEQTIERIEAQIFERYQQSGTDYLVDYLEGEQ